MLCAGLVLAALAFPAAAWASQYVLKHPKHEHCKAQYVRKTRRVNLHGHKVKQTVCVYVPVQPPTPPPPPCAPSPPATEMFLSADAHALGDAYRFDVKATVEVRCGAVLVGVPITYTIMDETNGHPVGSFTEPSGPVQPCTIVYRAEAKAQTFVGESVASYPGCALAQVSMPPGDIAVLTASFAGDSTYAASSDSGTL